MAKSTQGGTSSRQYRLCATSGLVDSWDDVPDNLIVELVRAYTKAGDAILFGTSKAQDVLAIRVYRGGEGYSVYSRGAGGIGEAVERLYRYRPLYNKASRDALGRVSEAQVSTELQLPYHPKFSRDALLKQRAEADRRATEWNRLVDSLHSQFYGVATA